MSNSDHIKDREFKKFFPLLGAPALRVGAPGGVEVTEKAHWMIHRGDFFSGGHIFQNVSDLQIRYILFKTGTDANAEFDVVFTAITAGNAILSIFEDAEVSDNGTPVNISPNNRINQKPPQAELFFSPTVTNEGNRINGEKLLVGGRGNQASGASSSLFDNEMIINQNTNYLIKIVNVGGNNALLAGYVTYYIERFA